MDRVRKKKYLIVFIICWIIYIVLLNYIKRWFIFTNWIDVYILLEVLVMLFIVIMSHSVNQKYSVLTLISGALNSIWIMYWGAVNFTPPPQLLIIMILVIPLISVLIYYFYVKKNNISEISWLKSIAIAIIMGIVFEVIDLFVFIIGANLLL